MSESTSTNPDWIEQPLTAEEIQQCVDAGCSEAFRRVLETDKPKGVNRHSVRLEVKKQLREWGKDPEDITVLAGDFFTHLWDGNRDYYTGYADSNNKQILRFADLI